MLYHLAASFIFHASICFFFSEYFDLRNKFPSGKSETADVWSSEAQRLEKKCEKYRNSRNLCIFRIPDEIHIELIDNFKVIQVACKGKLVEIERVSPQWSTSFQKVINALKCPTCKLIWHSPVENLEAVGKLGRAGTEFCKTALKFHMI